MNTGNVLLSSEDQELVTYMAEHPAPMWVYDVQTCRFLEVNPAAVRHYGYSRDEFLQMSLFDIRPEEDWPGLAEDLRKPRPRFQFSGGWRHRLKNGEIHEVEIRSQLLRFQGRPAAWVEVRDLTVDAAISGARRYWSGCSDLPPPSIRPWSKPGTQRRGWSKPSRECGKRVVLPGRWRR
ncbi:MAG: PAS domain S-box protein [Limisphaera sp.]